MTYGRLVILVVAVSWLLTVHETEDRIKPPRPTVYG